MKRLTLRVILVLLACATLVAIAPPAYADVKEWADVNSHQIVLIYPGHTSMEFLLSDDHRLGGKNISVGKKNCRRCHLSKKGELDLKADEIIDGTGRMKRSRKPFETEPIAGRKGTMEAQLQAAYDDEYIYVRLVWSSIGRGWKKIAGTPDENLADRVSLQINKHQSSFNKYGCFITCHSDSSTMPDSPTTTEVRSSKYYGPLKRDDIRLYTYYSRTQGGGWNDIVGIPQLNQLLKEGGLIDLWSAEISEKGAKAHDGWILEDRQWDRQAHVKASAVWTGTRATGNYSVIFKRKLLTGDARDVQIREGEAISIAVAIHDDNTSKRKHYVSFPMTIGLGTGADIKAKKINN